MSDIAMTIRLAGLVEESVVDGKGIRFTVFVQGCPHKCFNCHNPQTHDFKGGEDVTIEELLRLIKSNPLLDGITLSGGEPFLYAKVLSILCENVKKLGLNVWCYTGYTLNELLGLIENGQTEVRTLLDFVDVLVDGRYEDKLRDLTLKFRGSSNQRVLDLVAMRENNYTEIIELKL